MRFVKMHGLGNDYVFMDTFTQPGPADPAALSVEISRPHWGIGSDGLILIGPCQGADARMRIFNADGSEGETCGNGLRCVARYLYEEGLCDKREMRIQTGAGAVTASLVLEAGQVTAVTVDMGTPRLLGQRTVPLDGEETSFACVSMGNPHAVCFTRFPAGEELARLGRIVETDPQFPERTNVEFCRVSGEEIGVHVWERGSGITLACGSGACASLAAAASLGLSGRSMRVRLPGGALSVEWREDGHIYMTGPATRVFAGEI